MIKVLRADHALPTVRIKGIILENFKSVKHGEITFNCGRTPIEQDTVSDVLGVYGQNGSGKTALIEALSILKAAITGNKISDTYTKCIDVNSDYANLEFAFDFQYPGHGIEEARTVVYSFKISSVKKEASENDDDRAVRARKANPYRVKIFDERVSVAGVFDGVKRKLQPMITTDENEGYSFGPARKIGEYIGSRKESLAVDLAVFKREASRDSKSFVFSDDTLQTFSDNSGYSEYFRILLELKMYGLMFLYVVDKRRSSADSIIIPFNTRQGIIPFRINRPTVIPKWIYQDLLEYSSQINLVLSQIIPGMQLVFKDRPSYYDDIPEDDDNVAIVLYSQREYREIPLHYESEGIIKLVSILSLIISSFNDKSCTVAIDELDAGIYEYLLGEILIAYEEYGKGQLLFTSHNLRPLEVLKKENLVFTTSNPDNRYIRLKGVGKTNNLRNLYLREILDCNQEEELYSAIKRYRLISAFRKAGVTSNEKK